MMKWLEENGQPYALYWYMGAFALAIPYALIAEACK